MPEQADQNISGNSYYGSGVVTSQTAYFDLSQESVGPSAISPAYDTGLKVPNIQNYYSPTEVASYTSKEDDRRDQNLATELTRGVLDVAFDYLAHVFTNSTPLSF